MRLACTFLDLILFVLVNDLGNRHWTRREHAHDALMRLDRLAWPALSRGCEHHDPEVSARCRRLLAGSEEERSWELAGRILPRGWTRHPWLFLEGDPWNDGWSTSDVSRWCTEAAQHGATDHGLEWNTYRVGCRLWVQSQLRQYRSPTEIRFDLEVMVLAERRWWAVRGAMHLPLPLRVPLP